MTTFPTRLFVGVMTLGLAATPSAISRMFGIDIYVSLAIFLTINIALYKIKHSLLPLNHIFIPIIVFCLSIALSKLRLSDKEITLLLVFVGIMGWMIRYMCFDEISHISTNMLPNLLIYSLLLIVSVMIRREFPVSFEMCSLFFSVYAIHSAEKFICQREIR